MSRPLPQKGPPLGPFPVGTDLLLERMSAAVPSEEMPTLAELVEAVCSRPLSDEEVSGLTRLAGRGWSAREAVTRLMAAPPHGPANLRRAKALVAASNAASRTGRGAPAPSKERSSNGLQLTGHAVERFRQRHAPSLPFEEVLLSLEREASQARPVRERSNLGDEQWASPSGVRFVVRRRGVGPASGRNGAPVVTTILPAAGDFRVEHPAQRRASKKREG